MLLVALRLTHGSAMRIFPFPAKTAWGGPNVITDKMWTTPFWPFVVSLLPVRQVFACCASGIWPVPRQSPLSGYEDRLKRCALQAQGSRQQTHSLLPTIATFFVAYRLLVTAQNGALAMAMPLKLFRTAPGDVICRAHRALVEQGEANRHIDNQRIQIKEAQSIMNTLPALISLRFHAERAAFCALAQSSGRPPCRPGLAWPGRTWAVCV